MVDDKGEKKQLRVWCKVCDDRLWVSARNGLEAPCWRCSKVLDLAAMAGVKIPHKGDIPTAADIGVAGQRARDRVREVGKQARIVGELLLEGFQTAPGGEVPQEKPIKVPCRDSMDGHHGWAPQGEEQVGFVCGWRCRYCHKEVEGEDPPRQQAIVVDSLDQDAVEGVVLELAGNGLELHVQVSPQGSYFVPAPLVWDTFCLSDTQTPNGKHQFAKNSIDTWVCFQCSVTSEAEPPEEHRLCAFFSDGRHVWWEVDEVMKSCAYGCSAVEVSDGCTASGDVHSLSFRAGSSSAACSKCGVMVKL